MVVVGGGGGGGNGERVGWLADGLSVFGLVEVGSGRSGRPGRGSSVNMMDGPGPSSLAIFVIGTGEEEKRPRDAPRRMGGMCSASSRSRRSRFRPRGDSDLSLEGGCRDLTSVAVLSSSSRGELGVSP